MSDTTELAISGMQGKSLSRARREAMSFGGKTGLASASPVRPVASARPAVTARPTASVTPVASGVRKPQETISMPPANIAQPEVKVAVSEDALDEICSTMDEPGAVGQVSSSVRKLCQQRRQTLSSQGKKGVIAMSNKTSVGSGLTGRAAARARRESLCENGRGNDPACRPTGRVRPESSANTVHKVEIGTTLGGATVSGSLLDAHSRITGIDNGSCRVITGTEYIGTEQYVAKCNSAPPPTPAKVSVGMTARGQRVSGVDASRADKVTGTQLAGNKAVTGNEYLSVDKFEAGSMGKPAPAKVGISTTRSGMSVSGTEVGRSTKVTGDEYGSCHPISGSEYAGSDQFESFCDAAQQAASRALLVSRGAQAGNVSGIKAVGKITGAERGESMELSGTPYSTTTQGVSQRGQNSNPHPLVRGSSNVSRDASANVTRDVSVRQASAVQGAFSVISPASSAQNSQSNRISGTAYGAAGRITGPIALAPGLVSGTPEFRYQDEVVAKKASAPAVPAVEAARNRLTGDGREGGFAITGAAWRRNESVTGTEGASTHRNVSMRGDSRGTMSGASQMKGRERIEVPVSKITGSSGNDSKGSTITYSGGARG